MAPCESHEHPLAKLQAYGYPYAHSGVAAEVAVRVQSKPWCVNTGVLHFLGVRILLGVGWLQADPLTCAPFKHHVSK